MKKLTKQEVLELYKGYVGCDCIITEGDIKTPSILEGIDIPTGTLVSERVYYHVNEIKLSLMSLKSISDEHALFVSKIAYVDEEFHTIEIGKKLVIDNFSKESELLMSPTFLLYTYQYLQSKFYDLPHYLLDGKTLTESGYAVEK